MSEEDERRKGLSFAAATIDEGYVLYLQTVKALTVMFAILTILNLPLFAIYSHFYEGQPSLSILN